MLYVMLGILVWFACGYIGSRLLMADARRSNIADEMRGLAFAYIFLGPMNLFIGILVYVPESPQISTFIRRVLP